MWSFDVSQTKRKNACFIPPAAATAIMLILVLMAVPGCSRATKDFEYGASCLVRLTGMPDEFRLLPDMLQKDMAVTLALRNVSSDSTRWVHLNHGNAFSAEFDLFPGVYDISHPAVTPQCLDALTVYSDEPKLTVVAGAQSVLTLAVERPEAFAGFVRLNQPSADILGAGMFSRKAQIDGQIFDMDDIPRQMTFDEDMGQKPLSPTEVVGIASSSHEGVIKLVQNQTRYIVDAADAEYVGLRFTKANAVLPKGLNIGTAIQTVAHSKEGLFGTPSYCLGSPLYGLGIDSATFVYLDDASGDRYSLEVREGDSYLCYITYMTYMFSVYE